jgi:hypothetical protein
MSDWNFRFVLQGSGFFLSPARRARRVFVDGSLPIPYLPHPGSSVALHSGSHTTRTKKCTQPVFAGTIPRKGGARRRVVHLGSQAVTIAGLLTLNSHSTRVITVFKFYRRVHYSHFSIGVGVSPSPYGIFLGTFERLVSPVLVDKSCRR